MHIYVDNAEASLLAFTYSINKTVVLVIKCEYISHVAQVTRQASTRQEISKHIPIAVLDYWTMRIFAVQNFTMPGDKLTITYISTNCQ